MSFNIEVEGGKTVRLPTAGKYCDRDIVITAEGGTEDLDAVLTEQEELIAELQDVLKGKASGSGGITVSGENLHDVSTDIANIYLNGDNEVSYNGWDATDYIPTRADRSYLIYSTSNITGQYCNRYNASKTRIGTLPTPCNSTVKVAPLLYPGFDGYFRFSGTRQQIADLAVFEANALALEAVIE